MPSFAKRPRIRQLLHENDCCATVHMGNYFLSNQHFLEHFIREKTSQSKQFKQRLGSAFTTTLRDLDLTGIHEFDISQEKLRLNPVPKLEPLHIDILSLIQIVVMLDCLPKVLTTSCEHDSMHSDAFAA